MAKVKSDPAPMSALDRSPSHLLHRVLQLALDFYGEELGTESVTQRQFALLEAVAEHDGATQTQLVAATGIDRSTLADLAARMINKGYLERERSTLDARANAVRLTTAGRDILEAVRPKVLIADARILAMLSPSKRDSFLSALQTITGAASPVAETPEPKKPKPDKPPKADKSTKSGKKKKKTKDKGAKVGTKKSKGSDEATQA